ncbi:MAG TPA: IS110 family transposase [Bacillota bacterium]|nr:IS110 family transposase [Bacillota bacterium]
MKRIIYVGMDVHLSSYTMCCVEPSFKDEDKIFGHMRLEPSVSSVKLYLTKIAERINDPGRSIHFICGYEAGFIGYSLYHEMNAAGLTCVILAPSTMPQHPGHRIKTDKRDAEHIAKSLAYGTYRAVHIPTAEDEQTRDYLRMRNDHQLALKKVKQQINAFCLRLGKHYTSGRTKWSQAHLHWLRNMELPALHREILDEYLTTYETTSTRIQAFDQRIEELASRDRYHEPVKQLSCFIGIKTYTALSLLAETGDFTRFARAEHYASYLGLTPSEKSSGETTRRGNITRAGNTQMRTLLVEAAHCMARGRIGYKSKVLRKRQEGNSPQVIAYADHANERLRRKYYHMIRHGKKHSVTIVAIARELACFIWGMMNGCLTARPAG